MNNVPIEKNSLQSTEISYEEELFCENWQKEQQLLLAEKETIEKESLNMLQQEIYL